MGKAVWGHWPIHSSPPGGETSTHCSHILSQDIRVPSPVPLMAVPLRPRSLGTPPPCPPIRCRMMPALTPSPPLSPCIHAPCVVLMHPNDDARQCNPDGLQGVTEDVDQGAPEVDVALVVMVAMIMAVRMIMAAAYAMAMVVATGRAALAGDGDGGR